MRTTALITISLPRTMVRDSDKVAKTKQMTRSEFIRAALRRYIEEAELANAVRIADKELAEGKMRVLPRGGLAKLLKK